MARLSPEARAGIARFKRVILQDMPEEWQKRSAAVTLQQGTILADAIRRDAPVSEDKDPGQLRDSVRLEIEEGGLKATVIAGGGAAGGTATWNEFGTKFMAPQPFFWPNVRLRIKRIRSAYSRALTATMKAMQAKLT